MIQQPNKDRTTKPPKREPNLPIYKNPPPPPPPPLDRYTREGAGNWCENCGSTSHKSGFMGLFGERLCDNNECPNSKSRFKKR